MKTILTLIALTIALNAEVCTTHCRTIGGSTYCDTVCTYNDVEDRR